MWQTLFIFYDWKVATQSTKEFSSCITKSRQRLISMRLPIQVQARMIQVIYRIEESLIGLVELNLGAIINHNKALYTWPARSTIK